MQGCETQFSLTFILQKVESAYVLVQRMALQNMDFDYQFVNTDQNNEHFTSLPETKHDTKQFVEVEHLFSKINWNGFSEKFIEHMKSAYVAVDFFKCKNCDAVFHSGSEYYLHLVTHVQRTDRHVSKGRFVKRYGCDKCDKRFVQESTLRMHMEFHNSLAHICACGVGFYLKSDLLMHRELVHPAAVEAELARLTYRKRRALRNEYWGSGDGLARPAAPGPAPAGTRAPRTEPKRPRRPRGRAEREAPSAPCPHCGKLLLRSNLRVHLRTHTGERPHECPQCAKRFTQSGALKLHLKRHAGAREHACGACAARFYTRAELALHARVHSGERPLACRHCARGFADPSALQRHERTHSGLKPYACRFCGMRFGDASGRRAHELRHEGERRHACGACARRFYSASELRKHSAAVHAARRPFQCAACPKSFALKQYLALHVRRARCLPRFPSGRRPKAPRAAPFGAKRGEGEVRSAPDLRRPESRGCKKKLFPCEICDRTFETSTGARCHLLVHHANRYVECDHCQSRFGTKSGLIRHIRGRHEHVLKTDVNTQKISDSY